MGIKVKVEKANIRFKNLDPEYVNNKPKFDISDFHVGRKERTRVVVVRVSFETYHRMVKYSKDNGITISELMRRAIEKYLNSDEK